MHLFPRVYSAVFLTIFAAAPAVFACEGVGEPFARLSAGPGELEHLDRALTVAAYDNGCIEITRPVHFRDAGAFRLQLAAADREQLRGELSAPALRSFDATAVRTQIAERATLRGSGGRPELFEVHDADRYVLQLGAGGARVQLVWSGVYPYAEHYPEIQPLQDLRAAVDRLQKLAMRADAQPLKVQP